jgi:putative ABC transport system permease protein
MSGAGGGSALAFAWRGLRRGWRSGELVVLSLALIVAGAATVAVGMFSARVQQAVERGAGDAIGADAVIEAHDPLADSLTAGIHALGLRTVAVVEFASVVAPVAGEQVQLSSIKAVAPGFPLRGTVKIADQPYGQPRVAGGVPAPGETWIDAHLWTALNLAPGALLQLGGTTLKVTAAIVDEPGRGGAFAEMAPELMMNAADLPASQLLTAGSRAQYLLEVGGEPAAIAAAQRLPLPTGTRMRTPQDSRPEIQQSLKRAHQFLDIAALATLLLAASAVALSARLHSLRMRNEVAVLKCLGASRGFVLRGLVLQQLLLGLAAGGAGAGAGALGQAVLGHLVAPLLNTALPPAPWTPVPLALGLVVLLLAGFALPALAEAASTPPVQVFQRGVRGSHLGRMGLAATLAATAALAVWQAGSAQLAAYVLAGAAGTAALLAGLGWLLVLALAPLRRGGVAWRFGLGNIARRRGVAVGQVVALGIALLALLLVTVVRSDLLASWQGRLPPRTPNEFLIGIQPDQVGPLEKFFAAHGYQNLDLWPMVRARLAALNGKPVTADSFPDPETRRWINREFNLTWTQDFGDDNQLIAGRWWGAAGQGQPWLSVDQYAVDHLKLRIGDTLTLEIAGKQTTLQVYNTRKVRWDSFRPNFFLAVPPGVLEDSGAVQWITSFYLPPAQRSLLRELVRQFPNVTALDLDAALAQVRSIVDRIVAALELLFGATLAAGVVVMLAVIEGSRADRARETALLRALGASSRVILQGLLAEYAALGLLAGGVAAIAAQALAWVLAVRVFEIPYGPRPVLWLAGAASGCLLVTAIGWLSLRGVLRTPPRQVLASA